MKPIIPKPLIVHHRTPSGVWRIAIEIRSEIASIFLKTIPMHNQSGFYAVSFPSHFSMNIIKYLKRSHASCPRKLLEVIRVRPNHINTHSHHKVQCLPNQRPKITLDKNAQPSRCILPFIEQQFSLYLFGQGELRYPNSTQIHHDFV